MRKKTYKKKKRKPTMLNNRIKKLPGKPKWIEVLEKQLEREESAVRGVTSAKDTKRHGLNKEIAENFWHLWLRFYNLGAIMTMQPSPESFLSFTVYPEEWKMKEDYDFASLSTIALIDMTQEQNRVGDSLIANYFTAEGDERFRLVFEFLEGERYHKYSGWKRHVARHIIFNAPLKNLTVAEIRKSLGDLVKVWYLSHLKRNRKIIIEYVKKNCMLAETFMR